MHGLFQNFHPLVARWFKQRFGEPTEAQLLAWPEIAAQQDTLVSAPTGSGKTLAAFLACIDGLVKQAFAGTLQEQSYILYVSPLKALANDIRKNLEEPLSELNTLAVEMGLNLPAIRSAVRSGDTPQSERAAMLKNAPHILITTPESFYLLLTAEGSRKILKNLTAVIVDEIHAIAKDKRGAHLALSLARLDRLVGRHVPRVGLSATQKPIEEIARFLVGNERIDASGNPQCKIINAGHQRQMDLAIEIPKEEISAVASKELWSDIYDRVAELVKEHRSTLIFVNTRRLVERATHALAQRLGEESVLAHHGSLSKDKRLNAETQLKAGTTRAVVATASLELGIDVGAVDLVCHLGSPRSLAVGLQRIGRAGHAPSGGSKPLILPKGRIFPTTRDELIECAAFVRGVRRGNLESTFVMQYPLDVLAQQMVASIACEEMGEEDLWQLMKSAWPYARLPREEFEKVLAMLSEGISTARGSRGAWLHRDGSSKTLRPRRGARLTAITSGGAIPDNFTYAVVKEPEGLTIGSLDEDFAVESLAGDVFLLGNNSWKIRRVEAGRVRVEDAHGQPPTIPFWLGEAPGRSAELSWEVSDLRSKVESLMKVSDESVKSLLESECALPEVGASQALHYLKQGFESLGALPTQETLIAERFFDEGGGMQLILHAPFGSRLNRAFGLALRKKFCAGFNFELQAAATDDAVLLSLGPQHSFPLDSVFHFLKSQTVKETLEQAVLDSPLFGVRWRWNATRALALLRYSGGKRVPPTIQRMRSDDLLAAAFPDQAACQENVTRPIKIPDQALVVETLRNCLYEAMDLPGLEALLKHMEAGQLRLIARDTPTPSPLCHEILNSNPYTYLDDAPLEERRARAVSTRRSLSEKDLDAFGALDEETILEVEQEVWPQVRDADELADVLRDFILIPNSSVPSEWRAWLEELQKAGRVKKIGEYFTVTEKMELAQQALEGNIDASARALGAAMMAGGPASAEDWAKRLDIGVAAIEAALLQLESQGRVLRGKFQAVSTALQWCDREVLSRIHRRCLNQLRREIQPATTVEFLDYLLHWQHVAPGSQLQGSQGVLEVLSQLQGLHLPVAAWEQEILPARIQNYDSSMLNDLCQNGAIVWGKLFAKRVDEEEESKGAKRRSATNRNTSISLMLRQDLPWLLKATESKEQAVEELGESARNILDLLNKSGAMFFNELQTLTRRLRTDLDQALWELVAGGYITCDGFAGLRNLSDPERRREKARLLERYSYSRTPLIMMGGGRWSLLRPPNLQLGQEKGSLGEPFELEALADQYLRRWGIVFRDLLLREPNCPPWRVLLGIYRRLEARGIIRGGRFAAGFAGEQFALPEAVETLRSSRRAAKSENLLNVNISAVDPLNVTGYLTPAPRVPATLSHRIEFINGVPQEIQRRVFEKTESSRSSRGIF